MIFNGERLNCFSLRWGTRQWCILSSLLFNNILEFQAIAIRQEKEKKCIKIRKEEAKPPLFAAIILYIENPKGIYKTTTRNISPDSSYLLVVKGKSWQQIPAWDFWVSNTVLFRGKLLVHPINSILSFFYSSSFSRTLSFSLPLSLTQSLT